MKICVQFLKVRLTSDSLSPGTQTELMKFRSTSSWGHLIGSLSSSKFRFSHNLLEMWKIWMVIAENLNGYWHAKIWSKKLDGYCKKFEWLYWHAKIWSKNWMVIAEYLNGYWHTKIVGNLQCYLFFVNF